MNRRSFLSSSAAMAAVCAASPWLGIEVQGQSPQAGWQGALDAFVHDYLRVMNAPGMTLAIVDHTPASGADISINESHIRTYGFSEIESHTALRPEQLFQIGSITKSFVALTLLQLKEEGKLDLHKPVLEYLPWLPIESDLGVITVHALLTHSSGLPDALALQPPDATYLYTQRFKPGEHFHYCNLGYAILGELIRKLDGRPWTEAVRARIFEPLGMTATRAVYDTLTRRVSPKSYLPFAGDRFSGVGERLVQAGPETFEDAAGSICSTPADMARYMTMLLKRGAGPRGKIVSEASFALFSTAYIKAEEFGPTASYGYGMGVDTTGGHRLLRHTGGTRSYMSAMQLDLDAGIGVFASINAQLGYRPNPVAQYAIRLLRAEREKQPMPERPKLFDRMRIENAQEYAGTYSGAGGRKVTIAANGDTLTWNEGAKSWPIESAYEGTMFIVDPAFDRFPLVFGREEGNAKGPVVEIGHGADWLVHERYRGPREFSVPEHWRAYVGNYLADTPWLGGTRIVLRKDRLWMDGVTALVAESGNVFRPAEPEWNPERIEFFQVGDGMARSMRLSGTGLWRAEVD